VIDKQFDLPCNDPATMSVQHVYTPCMSNRFMARAIEIAIENVRHRQGGPFGAIIVKEGKIVAEGANCVTVTNDPTAHAEIVAIRKACSELASFELNGCEIYSSCEPCPMCFGALYWARPARLYFGSSTADAAKAGFDDSLIYSEMLQPYPKRKISTVQIMRPEALEAFRLWKEQPDKLPY
jgi:guanine deaminase